MEPNGSMVGSLPTDPGYPDIYLGEGLAQLGVWQAAEVGLGGRGWGGKSVGEEEGGVEPHVHRHGHQAGGQRGGGRGCRQVLACLLLGAGYLVDGGAEAGGPAVRGGAGQGCGGQEEGYGGVGEVGGQGQEVGAVVALALGAAVAVLPAQLDPPHGSVHVQAVRRGEAALALLRLRAPPPPQPLHNLLHDTPPGGILLGPCAHAVPGGQGLAALPAGAVAPLLLGGRVMTLLGLLFTVSCQDLKEEGGRVRNN